MARNRSVMVVHPVGDPQLMPTLRGINEYAKQQGTWTLQFSPVMLGPGLKQLKGWPGHGVIALLQTQTEVAAARGIGLPVVNLSGAIRDTGLPRVMVDQQSMGRLAAEHLLGCALSNFAYYGERDMWYSQQRKEGFMRRLSIEGRDCSLLETTTRFGRNNPWYAWYQSLERWLRKLCLPVGVFAVHDHAATLVMHACSQLGLRVPEDVAVLGLGNDRSACEFCEVSSIARNHRQVGYQAAALLDQLMSGKPAPEHDVLIPPEGVVHRHSTELVATDDPRVAAALRYIQEHIAEAFSVRELCEALDISHRSLDLSFSSALRCSPREYLSQARVKHAKRMLSGNEKIKLQKVARECGFSSLRQFYTVFRRVASVTPAEYRRRSREE